jgi:GntR family transcriptional repressor for pyruvate dehydrogenase complex
MSEPSDYATTLIHAPNAAGAAYMLGMVLQCRHARLEDLAAALSDCEQTCAAMAAERSQHDANLVDTLTSLNDEAQARIDDGPAFTRLARRFHDAVVQGCGNVAMDLVAGALETLWSNHESTWAEASDARGEYPGLPARKSVVRMHLQITRAIEEGDSALARSLVAQHLHKSQRFVLAKGKDEHITVEGFSKSTIW